MWTVASFRAFCACHYLICPACAGGCLSSGSGFFMLVSFQHFVVPLGRVIRFVLLSTSVPQIRATLSMQTPSAIIMMSSPLSALFIEILFIKANWPTKDAARAAVFGLGKQSKCLRIKSNNSGAFSSKQFESIRCHSIACNGCQCTFGYFSMHSGNKFESQQRPMEL